MSKLFNREVLLNIDGTVIRTKTVEDETAPILRVVFKIERTTSKEPNVCDLQIYNLSQNNRSKFQTKDAPVILEAGYRDNISQIFSGSLTFGQNKLEGRDWVTTLQAADGGSKYRSARINTSIKGPVKLTDILKTVAGSMGIGIGNTNEKAAQGSLRKTLTELANGIVLSGKSEKQLDKIVKSMGYSWSIQNGALQILGSNETVTNPVVVLSNITGMIGAPESGEDGFIKVRSLLQPELVPGRRIKIDSANNELTGFYRIEKSVFSGDTWGGDWYADLEAKPL